MLNFIYRNVYAECRYAECRYAECRYAERRYVECCYAESHSARSNVIKLYSTPFTILVTKPMCHYLAAITSLV